METSTPGGLLIRDSLRTEYADVYTPEALAALEALAPLQPRAEGADGGADRAAGAAVRATASAIAFLEPGRDHPAHRDHGPGRPRRQVRRLRDPARPASGSGSRAPARRPSRDAPVERSIRNVAYALLSGADGWMFDGEDALGQVATMSLDNQRNLKLAIAPRPALPRGGRAGRRRDERAGREGFFGRADHRRLARSSSTSPPRIFRARGLHLDDRHIRDADGRGFSASIVDMALYVVNNHQRLLRDGLVDRALPAEDPDRRGGRAVERDAHRARGAPRPADGHDQGLRAGRAARGDASS